MNPSDHIMLSTDLCVTLQRLANSPIFLYNTARAGQQSDHR